ncbi:MAG: hypothetical protein WCW26_00360 [Candidatus Buchananbacteria bacterium]
MSKKIKFFLTSIFVFGFMISLALPLPSLAACQGATGSGWLEDIGIEDGLLIPCECVTSNVNEQEGCLNINVFLKTLVNFSTIILALTGSAALLMFMYGGVLLILAAGAQERVQKGKAALQAAAIGIAIILSSWVIVNFVILSITKGEIGSKATIFGRIWSDAPQAKTK